MNSDEKSRQALIELGPEGATAFLAVLRIALAFAEATPGCVGKAKHILLDHLAEMPPEEQGDLYSRLLGVAINIADADLRGA